MRPASIPECHHETVFTLASEGKSTRAIAEHLGTLGITTSYKAVGRVLREMRKGRAEIAKAVVREKLSTTLTVDIDRLEKLIRRVYKRIRIEPEDDAVYCKLVEQMRKLIETKLKYSGAGDDDEKGNGDATTGIRVWLPAEE